MIKNRHTIRLKGYDYAQSGYYFVTVCTHERQWLFGEIINGQMQLNSVGDIVNQIWESLPNRFDIKLDQFQIMPNHVHAIIVIVGASVGAIHESPLPKSPPKSPRSLLSQIIGYFKMNASKMAKRMLWQRNYHEHIVRNERELWAIRQYIKNNPKNWDQDAENL